MGNGDIFSRRKNRTGREVQLIDVTWYYWKTSSERGRWQGQNKKKENQKVRGDSRNQNKNSRGKWGVSERLVDHSDILLQHSHVKYSRKKWREEVIVYVSGGDDGDALGVSLVDVGVPLTARAAE